MQVSVLLCCKVVLSQYGLFWFYLSGIMVRLGNDWSVTNVSVGYKLIQLGQTKTV